MSQFGSLNYIVVVAYMCLIATIGSLFYRRKTTAREYFLGGRSMSWLPVGISIIAADLSAISVMGTPAWSYGHNLELLWSSVPYALVAPIVIIVFIPFYTKLNLYTAYQYLEVRFSLPVRLLASVLFQLLRGIHVALVIYAPSLVVNLVTGLPVWECILFIGMFTTFYTTLGGMKAVIWTDFIQFLTVMGGLIAVSLIAYTKVQVDFPTAWAAAHEAGRLKLFNFATDPAELTSFWACLLGGAVLCIAPLTCDQAILQRIFTTKSAQDAKQSIILQATLAVPVTVLLYLVGTVLFVFYHFHPDRLAGLNSEDAILPFFAVRELPPGISGLIIAAIFAATMSVMSAGINSLTTATTVDFYQRLFRPGATPEHCARVGRIGTVCWGVFVTGLALFAKYLGELALSYKRASSVISGPLLGIFLLGMLSKRPTASGVLVGAGAGGAAVIYTSLYTDWSFLWLGPIGVAVTVLTAWIISPFTPPNPLEKIRGLVRGS